MLKPASTHAYNPVLDCAGLGGRGGQKGLTPWGHRKGHVWSKKVVPPQKKRKPRPFGMVKGSYRGRSEPAFPCLAAAIA